MILVPENLTNYANSFFYLVQKSIVQIGFHPSFCFYIKTLNGYLFNFQIFSYRELCTVMDLGIRPTRLITIRANLVVIFLVKMGRAQNICEFCGGPINHQNKKLILSVHPFYLPTRENRFFLSG